MLDPRITYTPDDLTLLDDGTMDTVVKLPDGTEWRYEDTSDYRDPDSGALDFEQWVEDVVLPDMDADESLWLDVDPLHEASE